MIALIVSPIVIGNIRKSEKASFERSINGLIESVRIDYSEDSFLAPREYFYEKKDLTLLTVDEIMRDEEVLINGRIDGNGFLYVDGDGIIHIENLCNKNYCASGIEDDIVIKPNETGEIPKLDKSEPMIKLNGEATIYLELEEPYTELGAIAKTKIGEELEYKIEIRKNGEVAESIDTTHEATYKIIYTTSSNEKTVSVTRTVIIVDMTPVITMTEPDANYVKEQEILINVSAIKPNKVEGFTYQINEEDPIEVRGLSKIIVLNQTGEIKVKVTVNDNHGHRNELSKTYRIDQTGPEITLNPERVELESKEALSYDVLTGVSVVDNIDGTIDPSKIIIGGDNLLSIPGTYEISYTVSDRLGNTTTKTRIFIVRDGTKPEIVLTPRETSKFVKSETIKIEATDNIRVDQISYVIIKDNVRGISKNIKNGESITINETGDYQIEVTAIDSSNNRETITSGVYKIDRVPPVITFEDITIKVTEVTGYDLMTGVTATDNSGVTPVVTYRGGLNATLGVQTITYIATDEAGNTSEEKTRTITVVEVEGPILNLSNTSTGDVWTKAQTITAYITDNSNISEFSYEVIKDNETQGIKNVTVSGKSGQVDIALNGDGIYQIKLKGTDQYGNRSEMNSGTYYIDVTSPTAPTMEFVYGDCTRYTQGTWTHEMIFALSACNDSGGPSGSTDNLSGVAKYQISADNVNWYDYAYDNTDELYGMKKEGTNIRYFRAVDHAGNVSTEIVRKGNIDTTPPTVPTEAEFVFDSCTRYTQGTWTNNNVYAATSCNTWNGASGSTDNLSGVAKYQISADNVNWYDYAYDYTNELYAMTTEGTHTRYFRAVDHAGNAGAGIARTANIDKTAPTLDNWWWGETTANVARLYIQTSDPRGINEIRCQASTQDGNYENWLSMGVVWDAGANAYRCDITPTAFHHYNQRYYARVFTKDGIGNNHDDNPWYAYVDIPNRLSGSELAITKGLTSIAGGYRYLGADPDNFVIFNGVAYRIIGVFGNQMKLIYWGNYTKAGTQYLSTMWDQNNINDWSRASLMTILNTTYWNTINSGYQNMVNQSQVWNLGGWNDVQINRWNMYLYERGTNVYNGRPTTWTGKIALMYPSDYLYATSGGSSCNSANIYDWSGSDLNTQCAGNSWLLGDASYQWTLTPVSDRSNTVWRVRTDGGVDIVSANNNFAAKPVLYLKDNVMIIGGAGTKDSPYILGW